MRSKGSIVFSFFFFFQLDQFFTRSLTTECFCGDDIINEPHVFTASGLWRFGFGFRAANDAEASVSTSADPGDVGGPLRPERKHRCADRNLPGRRATRVGGRGTSERVPAASVQKKKKPLGRDIDSPTARVVGARTSHIYV